MSGLKSTLTSAAAFAAVLLGIACVGAANAAVPTYTAHYEVEYKGRRVGESTQALQRDGDVYRFESVTRARGVARLLRPRPVVEQSAFEAHGETLRPLDFRLEDGTRRGDDNVHIAFDWAAGTARIETAEGMVELPLEHGVYDRATLQLALMQELAAEGTPGPHGLIDDETIKTYRYEIAGMETLETPAGTHAALKVTQTREGSSRHTIIWAAPALEYLPIKIEQRRNDEVLTTLLLESVQGL